MPCLHKALFVGGNIMRVITIIVFLVIGSSAFAQKFSYPIFNKSGKTIKDFIPSNWFLKDSTVGDLNGDKIPDLAMVVEYKDTIEEIRPDSTVNKASPRILLILFKNPHSSLYDLFLQNNSFIIRCGESGMDPEAYGKLSISKRVLFIEFDFIRGMSIYRFRYQKEDFYLIGATSNGVAGGRFYGTDVNFLTKKAKLTTGEISGEHEKVEWRTILTQSLPKLEDLKMLFTIEVLHDIYL
jgi:hypothetical protein